MPLISSIKTLLLIGASRGLGLALAEEYLNRGWQVVATERAGARSRLHDLLSRADRRLEIETVDINDPEQVAKLRARLASRKFDMLFVNAGVKNDDRETIADVSTDEFIRVMITNALSPMRVVESLQELVVPGGTIGVMTSGQGSISNNESGHYEVYRGSKAALNMSCAASPRATAMIREPCCSWLQAGCEPIWAAPRRISPSRRAYRTLRIPWTRRPERAAFNIWITSAGRCRGERAGHCRTSPWAKHAIMAGEEETVSETGARA
jgi:NADP-dependent 3-hydroxy acid dehydrogenase YdfG